MRKAKKIHPVKKLLLILILICALLLADSRFRIVTTNYELFYEKLPQSFEGFRIVQLSDIHGSSFGEGNSRLLEKVRAAEPDIIAITGDLADSKTDMAVVDALIEGLTQISPVYYVSGNHEWWAPDCLSKLKESFEKYGVIYLRNEYVLLKNGEESIVLAGVEDPNGPYDMIKPDEVVDIINESYPDSFKVLLGHRNYWIEAYPGLEVDIILCGHAHGGIIRLPFAGGVLGTGFELFPKYVDGVISTESYDMLVSRGIGGSVSIPRFLNNPEIVVLDLRCE